MKRKVQFNNFIQQKNENSFVTFICNQSLFSGRLQKPYLSTNLTRIVKHLSTMKFSQRALHILNADDIFPKFAFQCCDAVEKTEHKKIVKLQEFLKSHYHLTSFSLFTLIRSIFTNFIQCIECRSIFAIWRIEAYLSKMNFPPGFQFPKLFRCFPFQYSDVGEMMALIWHR